MSSLIGFRAGRGFPPPRGLITAASRYVTAVIQKNPPFSFPRVNVTRQRPYHTWIFIKTQRSTTAVPFVPAAARRCPRPSSPSHFLRDVGAATRWGRRPRERKILTIGKSRVVSQSSVETESSRVRVPSQLRRASCVFGLRSSRVAHLFFPIPRPASYPHPTSGVRCGSHDVSRPYFTQLSELGARFASYLSIACLKLFASV